MLIDTPHTPPELAKLLGTKPDTVRGWIDAGILEGVNVARADARRPRWIVMPEAWEAFMLSRSSRTAQRIQQTRQRSKRQKRKLKYCQL